VDLLFDELKGNQVVAWIRRTASEELGMTLDGEACAYLQAVVGNRSRELYSELEKLHLRYGKAVSQAQVKEAVTHSRVYTVFELMEAVSKKDGGSSVRILKRYLEEEDTRDAPQGLIGMLNRQIRLLWLTKGVMVKRGGPEEVQKKTGLAGFPVKKLMEQAPRWTEKELRSALERLRWCDDRLKSGSDSRVILETLLLSLCS
jgi:DNA polymerase-3 subunit delta